MTNPQTFTIATDAAILSLVNAHDVETWFISAVGKDGEELPTYSSNAYDPRYGFRAAINSARRGASGCIAAFRVVVRYRDGAVSSPLFARSSPNDGTVFDNRAW